MRDVSYYPGCSLHGTAREYDESFRGVCQFLGIELHELKGWTCCGASSAHCLDEELAWELSARNLLIAARTNRDLIVPCVACYSRFKAAQWGEGDSSGGKEAIRSVAVKYALDYLTEEEIRTEVKSKIVKPLGGLKVVCYYGCLGVRPPKLTGIKRYENPGHMDGLLRLLGAEPLGWSYKTDCCGASLMMTRTDVVERLTNKLIEMAVEAGADCVVTGCPLCQANLDTRQTAAASGAPGMPVLYFTELMGLALGHRDAKKWLKHHIVDPTEVLERKGLMS